STLRALANPATHAQDFVRPGHVFPLRARAGGVLERPGHTEAAVDLAQLAGLQPCGVLCEIVNDDGSMARPRELALFAARHALPLITIADLIAHRRLTEEPRPRPAITDLVGRALAHQWLRSTQQRVSSVCVGGRTVRD
ncbi:MAG: 3,4-dihydroxy 2-butanone 4-phosphate synthase / cyclohydrolase, partial [Myxococcales bacterium]|nr:3,4-dihydroxy 2-butanone 4-phosphate synthase / cyclohydrolase [Myxococcales bacterium]